MANLNLPLPEEMLARIDKARSTRVGKVARVAWIRDAIELALRRAEQAEALASAPPDADLVRRVMAEPPSPSPSFVASLRAPAPRREFRPYPKGKS